MLAKLTSKNQLTLPKSVTDSLGPVQYFEVQVQSGQVVLTPVRIQRGDAVRAKLAELDLGDDVLAQALSWAVDGPGPSRAARKPAKALKAVKAAKLAKPEAKAGIKKAVKAVDVAPVEKPSRTAKAALAAKTVGASSGATGATGPNAGKAPRSTGSAQAAKAVKAVKTIGGKTTAARAPVSQSRRRSAA
ncbi:hypothetical protein [Roseateles terrae]|uniref:SpoVT-AbrB domain-containing protein n=1 Tax=Roseateles terrae TaxID=431060 RepID=A0ABR6GXF1_9BURK|nr:hypothetical protein [Roseateles terrae]MBB3196785.1 hypothetical protein [Roseateles terrae]